MSTKEDDEASVKAPSLLVDIQHRVVAPDGGWGWVVALGCFLTHVLTDGMFYSFGVVYVELLDAFGGTKGETAWIGSIAPGVLLLIGPAVGYLTNRYGCRAITITGALISSASLILSSFAPNLYFLYFSLGFLTGIGYGMIYLPSIVCVSHYFDKKLALATGLGVCGAGIGTFIFGPFTKWLLSVYAWRGTFLIQGAIVLNCVACGMAFRPLEYQKPKDESKTEVFTDIYDTTQASPLMTSQANSFLEKNADNNAYSAGPFPLQRYFSEPVCSDAKSTPKTFEVFQENAEEVESKFHVTKSNQSEPDLRKVYSTQTCQSFNPDPMTLILAPGGVTKASITASRLDMDREAGDDGTVQRGFFKSVTMNFNFHLLRDKKLLLFIVSSFLYSIGYYVPYIYLPDRAKVAGIDSFRAAWLISSIGITNTAGRVMFGFISDQKHVNRLYLYNIALTLCGICTAIGPLFASFELLLVYTVLFGLFSGVTISLTSVLLVDLMGIETLTDAFGLCNLFCGIATFLGSPIAGWFYDATGSYETSFILAGVTIALSGVILFAIPFIDR